MDKDSKKLLIIIALVIGLFAAGFLLRFNSSPTGQVITIDQLHRDNIEGKESDINYVHKGFSFVYIDGLWYTQIQLKDESMIDVPLHYGPRDLKDIPVSGKLSKSFFKPEVYITFNPTEKELQYVALSSAELSLNLHTGMGVKPIAACDRNATKACKNRPILTCADKDKPIIYFKQTNSSGKVRLKGNCVELEGSSLEMVKATDRFLYLLYGVMQ